MRRSQPLGLDELMIVNPGPSDSGGFFLGEDGTLYQVQGLGQGEELRGPGQFFLGEDGTLYQVQGLGLNGLAERIDCSGEGLGEDDVLPTRPLLPRGGRHIVRGSQVMTRGQNGHLPEAGRRRITTELTTNPRLLRADRGCKEEGTMAKVQGVKEKLHMPLYDAFFVPGHEERNAGKNICGDR